MVFAALLAVHTLLNVINTHATSVRRRRAQTSSLRHCAHSRTAAAPWHRATCAQRPGVTLCAPVGTPQMCATFSGLWHVGAALAFCATLLAVAPSRNPSSFVWLTWAPNSELTGITNPVHIVLVSPGEVVGPAGVIGAAGLQWACS